MKIFFAGALHCWRILPAVRKKGNRIAVFLCGFPFPFFIVSMEDLVMALLLLEFIGKEKRLFRGLGWLGKKLQRVIVVV